MVHVNTDICESLATFVDKDMIVTLIRESKIFKINGIINTMNV